MNTIIEVNILTLAIFILLIVIGYVAYTYYNKYIIDTIPDYMQLELVDSKSGKEFAELTANNLPLSQYGNEYNISMWLKIHDYSYKHGEKKYILQKGNVEVFLAPNNNNLHIRVYKNEIPQHDIKCDDVGNCFQGVTENFDMDTCQNNVEGKVKHNPILDKVVDQMYDTENFEDVSTEFPTIINNYEDCVLYDIPVQTWTHISINFYGDNIDIYLDGKLDSSCNLNIISPMEIGNISLHPEGGYNGETNKFTYTNMKLSSGQIYKLYKNSPN